jgi:hypothetical protein
MSTLIPKYDEGATGAVNRPINQKLAESVSVLDFGADPTGGSDSTTAIQNALNSSLNVNFPNGTYKVTTLDVSNTGTVITGSGQIINISADGSGTNLYVQPFVASTSNMRIMWDKSSTLNLATLLEFKNLGFNTVVAGQYISGAPLKKYLDDAYSLQMGVIWEHQSDTPDVTYDNHPALVGYYLYDEPANQSPVISVATQNTRINAWKAVTNKPVMCSFHGQNSATNQVNSPLWDIIFVDWYYGTALSADDNKTIFLQALANVQYTCPFTKCIPVCGVETTAGSTSKTSAINFSKDVVRFNTDNGYAVFCWAQVGTEILTSPQNDADLRNFCKELPILVSGKAKLYATPLIFNSTSGEYFSSNLSGTYLAINQISGGLAFQQSGGTAVFNLPVAGMVNCQFLFRNVVPSDVSTTTIRVYGSTDCFVNETALQVWPNVADATYLSANVYTSGDMMIGINFVPATNVADFHKYLLGFMIYSNWTTLTF